jgi:molybdate transport system permease protein
MPLAVYQALESDPEAAIALSLVLLLVSVVVLLGLRDRWLRPLTTSRGAATGPTSGAATPTVLV